MNGQLNRTIFFTFEPYSQSGWPVKITRANKISHNLEYKLFPARMCQSNAWLFYGFNKHLVLFPSEMNLLHIIFQTHCIRKTLTVLRDAFRPSRVLVASDICGGQGLAGVLLSAVSEDLKRNTLFALYPVFRFMVGLLDISILVASVICRKGRKVKTQC